MDKTGHFLAMTLGSDDKNWFKRQQKHRTHQSESRDQGVTPVHPRSFCISHSGRFLRDAQMDLGMCSTTHQCSVCVCACFGHVTGMSASSSDSSRLPLPINVVTAPVCHHRQQPRSVAAQTDGPAADPRRHRRPKRPRSDRLGRLSNRVIPASFHTSSSSSSSCLSRHTLDMS